MSFVCCVVVGIAFTFTSCRDDVGSTNRYTFTGQTIADFLRENEDQFSDFITILERGGKFSLMKAYGTYTCFAPTNEAVERYLVEQDSIWRASLDDPEKPEIWTGITSPRLEDLSDSMCVVISKTHLLGSVFMTFDMEGDVLASVNMNDRYLTLDYSTDDSGHSQIYVNGACIIDGDEEVENGVVHAIDAVMNPSSRTVAAEVDNMPFLSIFNEALLATGLDQALSPYKDESYTEGDKLTLELYNNNRTCPYPPSRYYGFTAFCEPDEVFNAYGIYSLEDLYLQCKKWYPNATDEDFTSKNNALWQFMAYHLLDRKLPYTRLVHYNIICNYVVANFGDYASELRSVQYADRYDYFETLQGTVMKVTMPRSKRSHVTFPNGTEGEYGQGIYINYCKEQYNASDPFNVVCSDIPIAIRISNPTNVLAEKERYQNYNQEALNGSVLLIDHPLVYNEDVMAGHVLNEMIRIDFSSLIPELTNNHMRWYGGSDVVFGNLGGLFYMPQGYSDRFKIYTDETYLYYCGPHNEFNQYMGDLMSCRGMFDIAYRLPHVPPGTYEIRVGYVADSDRGIVQYYVDDEITGIPVNMRLSGTDAKIGYVKDAATDDNGVTNDKQMKNRGYLKGPTTYYTLAPGSEVIARDLNRAFRLVLTTKYLGDGDHWVRIKNVNETDVNTDRYMHDYIELVPTGWMRRDDISLADQRK